MKRTSKLLIYLFSLSLVLMSCDSLLDADSDRFVSEEDRGLGSPSDSLYSMVGILSQMQKLSDTYIFLGELRGELLDVTDEASLYLKELNNHEVSLDNPYNDISVYYNIINNCNYVIENIDTAYQSKGENVLLKQFVQAKAIRAWTYLQLAINYGTAEYFEKPVLHLTDADEDFPVYDINQLAAKLIPDLLPWKNVEAPTLGEADGFDMKFAFFPLRMILGDLYLWSGDYFNAANEYRDLMFYNEYLISEDNQSAWVSNNGLVGEESGDIIGVIDWRQLFGPTGGGEKERITSIGTSSEFENASYLFEISNSTENHIVPSEAAIKNWTEELYFKDEFDIPWDLRGQMGAYTLSNYMMEDGESQEFYSIYKYQPTSEGGGDNYNFETRVYRVSHLYLHYAEAVNRLGKPNLAFAVIKNGLNRLNLADTTILPKFEREDPLPNYMDFDDTQFSVNIGTALRGQGVKEYLNNQYIDARVAETDSSFIIPELSTLDDSIMYVEDLIVRELALETAFEGNRFGDLIRVATRRSDPAFLADRVAEKHTFNKEAIRAKLLNMDNWYLPR